jgi:hypothetical protein
LSPILIDLVPADVAVAASAAQAATTATPIAGARLMAARR